ncbi:MAG: transposase [Rhizobacter sp.]|nr:transposase [Rhizobacter sp.]
MIVFIDESGLSERPTRVRTRAQRANARGAVPLQLEARSGHRRADPAELLVPALRRRGQERADRGVLKELRAQLKRKLLIVWDGAAQHKSRIVREYLDSTHGAVQMALLPGYAPDLNPVEYLWAWLKRHALANFCPRSLTELKTTARNKPRSGQHRQSIVTACWKQAELW